MDSKTARIRALNDQLRQNFTEGIAVMTPGIAALGAEAVARIVRTVAVFDDFCHANDPHEEHDFGAFDADGHRVFFKIEYFDETLTHHSADPADPSVTKRVITLMLAEEYCDSPSGRVAVFVRDAAARARHFDGNHATDKQTDVCLSVIL